MLQKQPHVGSFSSREPLSYRGDIDGLRAAAILPILLYHLHAPGFSGGFLGVDVFFVISGFLITLTITSALDQGNFSFKSFVVRRGLRLLPSLLVMLAFSIIGAALTLSVSDMKHFGASLLAALSFIGNFHFYQYSGGYFDGDSSSKPLLHLWSLGIEMQFYLLWALLLLVVGRVLTRQQLLLGTLALAAVSLIGLFWLLPAHANAAFYLLPSRIFEFMLGAMLVWLPRLRDAARDRLLSDMLMLGGFTLLILAIGFYDREIVFPAAYVAAVCIGATLLLYGAPHSTANILLTNSVARYIGRISYELYLFHWPLIVFYTYVNPAPITLGEQLALVAATFILSALTYHLIGRPMREASLQLRPLHFLKATTMVATFLVVACAGFSMIASHGWTWRLPADHRLFIADPLKFHSTKFGGLGYQENKVLTLGDHAAPASLIVIGDSYAGQYAAALDDLLKKNNQSAYLYYVNGCLLIPGGSVHMQGLQTTECLGAHNHAEDLLAKHPSLPVLQAQSWESYQDGIYHIAADSQAAPYVQDANTDYYDTLKTTLSEWRSYLGNRNYMVLGIAPGIADQQPIARCLAGPALFTKSCEKSAAAPAQTRLTGETFHQRFSSYFAANPNITFLNPRAAFCRDGFCYALDNGRVFYSDPSHLTTDGAMQVLTYYSDVLL